MLAIMVDVSKRGGLKLLIYDDGEDKGIYGISLTGKELEEKMEEGVRYRIKLESLIKVEQLIDNETVEEKATISPFDDDDGVFSLR